VDTKILLRKLKSAIQLTVVLASAMIDSGKHAKVIAVEKFAGGSNVEFGSKDENLAKIRSLFDAYGVSDRVVLFAEYLTEANAEELQALISTEQVGLLMVDADGRLDVHLPLIWSRLAPHCSIVLDDYRERHEFAVRSEKHPQGRTKELLCFRLVNKLQELGYIEIERVLGNTVFARKARSDVFGADDRAALREEVSSVEREYAAWLAQARAGPSSG
jgi:hypothetical protein